MRILKPLLLILILLCLKPLFAQIETVNDPQFGDTCVPASVDDYNRLIKYFMAEKEETKQLYKIDLIQYALVRPNIAYEIRIKNNLNAEFSFLFDYGKYTSGQEIFTSKLYLYAPTADIKYFHNMKQRKAKGKNINGFSGNFISAGFGAYIFQYSTTVFDEKIDGSLITNNPFYFDNYSTHLPYNDIDEPKVTKKAGEKIVWRKDKYSPNESIAFIRAGYGIQRRLGNVGYVATDFNFGVGTNHDLSRLYLMPELRIKAGFAISSFRKK